MGKAKFDKKYQKTQRRLKTLPEKSKDVVTAQLKLDAQNFIREFGNGIRFDRLGLLPLKDATIERKSEQGMRRPRSPLAGRAETDKKSYSNMLIMRETKRGYRVHIRAGNHWSGVPLKMLYQVHEFGAIIKRGNSLIRIPPRPAHENAFQKMVRKRSKREKSRKVKTALMQILRTGQSSLVDRINAKNIG